MATIKYRLTATGRTLVEARLQKASMSEEVLDLLLEDPEQPATILAERLGRSPDQIKKILDQHIQHGRVVGVLEQEES